VTPLQWTKGGEAVVVACDDDAVTLVSTTPAPPGARLEGRLGQDTVKIKSHGSKRRDDGRFTIQGRLLDANRALRVAVAAAACAKDEGDGQG
jgi:hypothetical protein